MYCTTGNVYSVASTTANGVVSGQLRRISATGVVEDVGSPVRISTQFNGLGIGSGGDPIYAYDRTPNAQSLRMYVFDHSTNTWTDTGRTYNTATTTTGSFNGSLIGGAVDLSTDQYYFGGFVSGGNQFKIWRYNHSTGAFTFKGTINTAGTTTGNANGDFAFDNAGNLFIVRNLNTETRIFSVTNEALAAANGGTISSSASGPRTTSAGMNGVAFDSAGKAYMATGTTLYSYDMPGFTNEDPVTSTLGTSTDLASCGSAPTVTVEKDVKNRVNSSDQFALTLALGQSQMGTTTSGTANGIQPQRVGPIVTGRGAQITVSEAAASGTDLSKYSSSYSCTIDGQPLSGSSGTGTSKTITIPPTGTEIVCRFVNSPLTADVTVNKKTQDQNGANTQDAAGWTVGAKATATSGTVTRTPNQDTQQTGTDGNAKWTLAFGSASARANLAVSESQQTGYEFVSGSCKITRLDGTTANVTLSGAAEQTLSSAIQPGDKVECGYVNKKTAADVTVNKDWVIDGKTVANGSQPDGISAKLLLDPAGQPTGDPAFGQKRTGFAVGDTVKIGETTTIDAQKFPGCTLKSKTISGPGITGTVALTDNFSTKLQGASSTYKVTNTVECQTLTIVKNVENDNGGTLTAADWNQKLFATPGSGSRLVYNSGEKKYVPTGVYTISEDSVVGYEQVSVVCTGGASYDDATKRVTVNGGQNATCTIKNTDSTGTVAWQKTNESGDLLDGSEWTIRDSSGNEINLDDCVANSADGCTGRDKDPAAGKFRVDKLGWGDYTLVETKAPGGYKLDETPRKFTISREKLDFAFDEPIVNKQAKSPQLPFTGGIGTVGFVIAGAALLLAGAAAALWQYRRRMHGRS